MKKLIALILLPIFILGNIIQSNIYAVNTNGMATPWNYEKAKHLARATLFYADSGTINSLVQAGSAEAAVDILFPNENGPDRTQFNSFITNYTASGFNWTGSTSPYKLYQLTYATDPYETKRKLFSLFEDIYSVNTDNGRDITYKDIYDQHNLIYDNMLGNYETLVKKLLYNNGGTGDYTEGSFLDLFNQTNPNNPNENYARELLQLFMMGEYEPFKSKDNGDIRNYEESDVKALAKILTGLNVDKTTRTISINPNTHYSGAVLSFLSGSTSVNLPTYYDAASGTINPTLILNANNGNNGLTDNVIEYIFAKRSQQVSLFLADRLYRFYVSDNPTRSELDTIATMIVNNNFNMLLSVKQLLASDMMYSEKSINTIRYKNPLELAIGTIKLLHNNDFNEITLDPNVYDTNLLNRLGWTPYYPGSVFGRDGFDNSSKWISTSILNTFMSSTNYFSYRNGTGSVDFHNLLGNYRKELNGETIPVLTNIKNNFTGSLILISGTLSSDSGSIITINPINNDTGSLNNTGTTDTGTVDTGSILINTGSENNTGSTNTGTIIDTGSTNTGSVTNTGTTDTGSTDTGSTIVNTGSTDTGSTDTGSINNTGSITDTGSIVVDTGSTNTGSNTDTGSVDTGSIIISFEATGAVVDTGEVFIASEVFTNNSNSNSVAVSSGYVSLPDFKVITDVGTITIFSGSYNSSSKTINISSGSLDNSGSITPIYSGSLLVDTNGVLFADTLTDNDIINIFSNYILGDIVLPNEVNVLLSKFLTTDEIGNNILVTPGTTEYYDKKIRGIISIIMSQPEYVLLRGYDQQTAIDSYNEHLLDNKTSKLIIIELYGGNDYLQNVIPKDEYATYLNYRTANTGSIALSGSELTDLDSNYYMNTALANGSGGIGFKSLYDEGSLRIFNRVGTPNHSQDHDAAAKQMTSVNNITSSSADGVIGQLVKNEYDGTNVNSLGAKIPNIFRGGHYVNLGGSIILSNPMNGSIKYHMSVLEDILQVRTYPGNTRNTFSDAGKISDIAKMTVAQGGPSGANGDMNNVFKFLKILLDNNVGRNYYMGGYGGYDTHDNEYTTMQKNLSYVGDSVTKFFNSVKGTQDVTIVIFSEFGRTNKVNGTAGTDHGAGGGMYVITSNTALKNNVPNLVNGNLSIQNSKSNALGVGVDYRSVYKKIFSSLYGIDGDTYFNTNETLENDINITPNELSLLSYSYQASGKNIIMNGEFTASGVNYDPTKAGYTQILSGTGVNNYKKNILNHKGKNPQGYTYTFNINSNTQPYFGIETYSNQYSLNSVSVTLTGSLAPQILQNTTRNISQTGTSILPVFNNTISPKVFVGTGIILELTGSNTITPNGNQDFSISFSSGITQVNELTSYSGNLTWNGGFILGENIDKNTFIPNNAIITNSGLLLSKNQVIRLVKLGADRRGVGMLLNQPVEIVFNNISNTGSYRIVSSEDGINWSDLEMGGKLYQASVAGKISAMTNHFSYFALINDSIITPPIELPPSCILNIAPVSINNGDSAVLSWSLLNVSTGTLLPSNSLINSNSGSINVIPPFNTTTTYTIQVSNTAGNSSCNTSITSSQPTNTGSTNTGSTNTGSTNTGITIQPPVTIVGPGGGGGGSPTSTYNGNIIGVISTKVDTNNNPVNNTSINKVELVNTVIDNYVNVLIDNGNEYSPIDKQKALRAGIDLWKIIVNDKNNKEELFNKTIAILESKVVENNDKIFYGISDINNLLQNFKKSYNNDSDNSMNSNTIGEKAIESNIRYVSSENSLTLRSDMVISHNSIIGYISRNESVKVLMNIGDWSKVDYNGNVGYVKSSYLRNKQLADSIRAGEEPMSSGPKGTVIVDKSAYIRSSDGKTKIVGVVNNNDELTILDSIGGWFEVVGNGIHGYIAKWLIKIQ